MLLCTVLLLPSLAMLSFAAAPIMEALGVEGEIAAEAAQYCWRMSITACLTLLELHVEQAALTWL